MRTRGTTALLALACYLATRVFSAGLLLIAAAHQSPTPWVDGRPSYVQITGLWWDAGWYERAATQGYPVPVPIDERSAWAFYPLFPLLVRGTSALTGGSFEVIAPTIALLAGVVAAVLLGPLVRAQAISAGVADGTASWRGVAAVAALGLFPAAPVLQAGYADALALAFVVAALALLARRRYLWTAIVVLALGFTRPVALPFALVVAWHAWRRYRSGDRPTPDERWRLIVLGATSVVAGLAWPVITAVVAGQWDAYLRIQELWRSGDEVAPVLAWFTFAWSHLGWAGVLLVLVAIGYAALALTSRGAREMGQELRSWTAAYLLWLLAAIQPHSSTIRQLLLAVGLPLAIGGGSRVRWALLLVASAAGQVWWVMTLWRLGMAPDWPP